MKHDMNTFDARHATGRSSLRLHENVVTTEVTEMAPKRKVNKN